MANNKNRKLSGVVLTGALVAPAVMSAAQQNVVSADLGSLLSSAKKFGSLALKGAGSFFNTRKGQIVAVVAFVGLGYGLFCLLKRGYEYIRNKTTDKESGINGNNKIDDDIFKGSQKHLTDKAGYKQFMENLRDAREVNKEFDMQTSEMQDEVTITLEKSGRSLKIVANFKEDNLEKIIFEDNTNLGNDISIKDNFANKLVENVNNFFKEASVLIQANTGVQRKEVGDVGKIEFKSTGESKKNDKDLEFIKEITNDDETNDDNQAAEVGWNDYKKFIKGLENAIANSHTELFKTEETKNKDETITTLTKQEKVLKIKATFKEGKLQKTEVARKSEGNEEIYTENDAKGLLTTMNNFFKDVEVPMEAYSKSAMKVPISVNDIDFKVNKEENKVVLDENKNNVKKEQIKKAIDESTIKEKIEAHVKNLIENKIKNKQDIKSENIKIDVKDNDVTAIKGKIKVGDYLESNNIKQDIEEAVKKTVSDKYGKEVDEKIKSIEQSIEEATKDVALKEQIGNILVERGFEFDKKDLQDKNSKVDALYKKVELVKLNKDLNIHGEANENAVKAAVNKALKQQLGDDINRLAERILLYNKVVEIIGANTKDKTNSKAGTKRNYIEIEQEGLKKILGENYNDLLNVKEGVNVYLEDDSHAKNILVGIFNGLGMSAHHFVLTFDEKNNRYIFKSDIGSIMYIGNDMNELIKKINEAFKKIYNTKDNSINAKDIIQTNNKR